MKQNRIESIEIFAFKLSGVSPCKSYFCNCKLKLKGYFIFKISSNEPDQAILSNTSGIINFIQ